MMNEHEGRQEGRAADGSADPGTLTTLSCGSAYRAKRLRIDGSIGLFTLSGTIARDCRIFLPAMEDGVSLLFVQSGRATLIAEGMEAAGGSEGGAGRLVYQRSFRGALMLHEAAELSLVVVSLPFAFLCRAFNNRLPEALRRHVEPDRPDGFQDEIRLTAAIQSVLHQIASVRLSGDLQTIFLTSKTYELIALGLEQFCLGHCPCGLSAADIARLKKARDILEENLIDPPSILELAHRVGINDCKLKKGFKALFDTTPFGYLKERRMIAARSALLEGDVSVTEVANQVGYTNLGHFAAAFRKQFGTPPKGFKKLSQDKLHGAKALY
ncbi:AraC-like DNA-binding protein [Azospirillum agricola]|uniref:helix-turn-helix transcriptional regulator n=1 Tax=Azospirillum agricola TaxID=1720247 RepID=UPI001AE91537|nr:AraC family transcriptional regulator [Azospirillum agricola]MBP2231659.1 AraC-like DNA-binding protein [Azospirillum agricola]